MFNPDTAPGGGAFFQPAFEAAARVLKVETITAPVRSDAEIVKAVELLGRERGGLVVGSDSFMSVHRRTIIAAAALQKVPFIIDGPVPDTLREGGLITYGSDNADIFRRCATYIDRILKGANPTELPVQVPTKFVLAINLKTAKALKLVIPQPLLATADEVIE
jgi:putative ABC transport system substrate-binding protein